MEKVARIGAVAEVEPGGRSLGGASVAAAFSILRDREAVSVLFDELAERFADRPGGYTRVVRLAQVRLGDAGRKAIIEFTGERDRVKGGRRRAAPVVADKRAKS